MKIIVKMYFDQYGTELGILTDPSIHRYECETLSINAATPKDDDADNPSETKIIVDIRIKDPLIQHVFPRLFAAALNKKHRYATSQSEDNLLAIATPLLHTICVNQARINGALLGLFANRGLSYDTAKIIGSYLNNRDGTALVKVSRAARRVAKIKISQISNSAAAAPEKDAPQNNNSTALKLP